MKITPSGDLPQLRLKVDSREEGDSSVSCSGRNAIPLPVICLGGAYIPLNNNRPSDDGQRDTMTQRIQRGTSLLPSLRVGGKKVVCPEMDSARAFHEASRSGIIQFHGDSSPAASVTLSTARPTPNVGVPDEVAVSGQQYISVPLHFALEMVGSFPKSYLWLSENVRARRDKIHKAKRRHARVFSGADVIDDIPVYSIPDLNIVQFSDSKQVSVQYKACFMSKKQLEGVWKLSRKYLVAATLTARHESRKDAIDAVRRKLASKSSRWFPRIEQGIQIRTGDDDEDGLAEPPEVQELAQELGMNGGPPSMPESIKPSFKKDVKMAAATIACGGLSILAPFVYFCANLVDTVCASLPILDSLVLKTVPPHKAVIQKDTMSHAFMSAHAKNIEVQQAASDGVQEFSQRLALSALWMGISMNLVLQQYMLGSPTAIIVASHGHPPASDNTMDSFAASHNRVGKPTDPLMMDILSTLIGSLQANDFVTRSTVDTRSQDDNKSVLELENILSVHNGVNIEYAKPSKSAQPQAHGVLLIGDFDVDPEHRGDPSKRSSASPSGIPVSVHNGHSLMNLMNRPVDTENSLNK